MIARNNPSSARKTRINFRSYKKSALAATALADDDVTSFVDPAASCHSHERAAAARESDALSPRSQT